MQTVDVSYTIELPVEDIRAELTPEAILECAELYEIESVETVGETVTVTTSFRDEELVFSFSPIDDGYEYTMVSGENLFAERYSRIIVTDLGETRITAETRFTLDTWLSVVLDRLARGTVRKELDNVVVNLVERAMDDDAVDNADADAADNAVDNAVDNADADAADDADDATGEPTGNANEQVGGSETRTD